MSVPMVPGLRSEVWRTLTGDQRIEALSEFEVQLAQQDGRTPAGVKALPPDRQEDNSYLRGGYDSSTNTIYIAQGAYDPEAPVSMRYGDDGTLASTDSPYMAAEQLLHEDRHAHQRFVAQERPELAASPEQLQECQQAYGTAAEEAISEPQTYSRRPTEIDARATARAGVDEMYGQEPGYVEHREHALREEAAPSELTAEALYGIEDGTIGGEAAPGPSPDAFGGQSSEQAANAAADAAAQVEPTSDAAEPAEDQDYYMGQGY